MPLVEQASELRRHIDVIGNGRVRIVEEREIDVDPVLLSVLQGGGVPIGMQHATDTGAPAVRSIQPQDRQRYETRSQLLQAKEAGLITGREPWYRTEYMRLSQNERREGIRKEAKRRHSKKSLRARAR